MLVLKYTLIFVSNLLIMQTIKKVQLIQWLGDEANDSEKLVTMLHELLTGKYKLDVFKEDVSNYDVDDVEDFKVGDSVIVPEPLETDMWNHGGWVGVIDLIKPDVNGDMYAEVTDGDNDTFCIELNRLTFSED